MKYLFWFFLAVFTLVALSSLGHFFFSKDKYSQKRIRSFVKTKGILYFFLAIGAIIYEIFTLNNYSPTVVLTIYIAVFETVQNIAQARAEEYQEKVQQALENHANKNDHTLKNIEKIFVFCTEVLEPLKHGHKTEDNIKLAYEQIYDYLKYYSCADQFFNVFDDYINNLFIMQNAVENGLCRQNPAGKSIRLPKVERADKQALTQEQYDVVYEMAKREPNGLSVMLMMETGVSRSELLGVTWKDLDLENGILHINQGLVSYVDADRGWVTESDGLKNAYRRRAIPIVEPELLKRLREKPRRIKLKRKTPYGEDFYVDTEQVFHSPEGFPYQPNNWNNRVFLPFMRKVLEAHPVCPELSAHELRHTRATLWIAQGVSPMMTARLLGHSDITMLMKVYDHTDVETLRRILTDTRKSV